MDRTRVICGECHRGWQIAAVLVLVVTALYAVGSIAKISLLVQDYQLIGRLLGPQAPTARAELHRLVSSERTVNGLNQWMVLLHGITLFLWFMLFRGTARRYGDRGQAVLRHWALTAWRVGMVGLCVLTYLSSRTTASAAADPSVDAFQNLDRNMIMLGCARIAAAGNQMRVLTAEPSMTNRLASAWRSRRGVGA